MPESEYANCNLCIRVEYHTVLEYCLKLGSAMPYRCKRPNPADDSIPDQPKGKKQKQSRAGSPKAKAHVGKSADLLDLIEDASGANCAGTESEGDCVEVVDEGVDYQDETSSIASGPSQLSHSPSSRPETLPDLCAACRRLYKRTKRMKGTLKNKLLNTDPDSLECHMWVLIKARRPRRPPDEKRDLLTIVRTIKKTLQLQTPNVREGEVCSRPRVLLQRNLRKVKMATKKKKGKGRGKRARGGATAPSPPTVAQKLAPAVPRAPTRFEKLLSQMQSNRSTIIRESST